MDRNIAWENFKKTGDINMFLEMKAAERFENGINQEGYNGNIKEKMGDTWQMRK